MANCDGGNTHAIITAVTHGERDIVDYLLKKGASRMLNLLHGRLKLSLLHMAIEFGQMQMVWHLLTHGADARILGGEMTELTVLHFLASGVSGEESFKPAVELVRLGVLVDGVDADYEAPLAVAVRCSNFPLAEILLRLGANPNAHFRQRRNLSTGFAYNILGTMVEHPNEATVHQVAFVLKAAVPYGLQDLAVVDQNVTALELVAKEKVTRPRTSGSFEAPETSPSSSKMQKRNDNACVKMADLLLRYFGFRAKDIYERRALAFSAGFANLPVLKLLLERGVDPTKATMNPPFKSALEMMTSFPRDEPDWWSEMPGSLLAAELIILFLAAKKSHPSFTSVSSGSTDEESIPEPDFGNYDITFSVHEMIYDLFLKPKFDFNTAWKLLESAYEELPQRRGVASEMSKTKIPVLKMLQDLAIGRSLASDLDSGTLAAEGANNEKRCTIRGQSINADT